MPPSAAFAGVRLPTSARGAGRLLDGGWLPAAVLLAAAVSVLVRFRIGLDAPFWIDESWTGAIASQPTPGALLGQMRDDPNGPLYYGLVWLWAKAFGVSDLALRTPGLLLSLAAPVFGWAALRRTQPVLALAWAGLLATWAPGIALSAYARCYPLLLALAGLATAAHVRLLGAPTLKRGVVWAAAACAMTLTHYHAGLLALAQGLVVLAALRGRAWRLWPAAAAFLPAALVLAWHAPRLAAFARPGVAWYDPVTLADLPRAAGFLVGVMPDLALILGCALLARLLARRTDRTAPDDGAPSRAILWSAGAALAGAAACLALGVVRPSFTLRYLTPFAPAVMLAATALVQAAGRGRKEPLVALVAGAAVLTGAMSLGRAVDPARVYSFEPASAWLAQTRPTRLAFLWDHPSTPVQSREQLDAVGGFFLRRAGLSVAVAPVVPRAGADMNVAVAAAAPGERDAILWLYDTQVRGTSAIAHPPVLARLARLGRSCRDFGDGPIGVVACRSAAP